MGVSGEEEKKQGSNWWPRLKQMHLYHVQSQNLTFVCQDQSHSGHQVY